jgi:hypothetical protein
MATESHEDAAGRLARFVAGAKGDVYAGLDPGTTGALALLDGGDCCVVDLPYVEVPRTGKTPKGNPRSKNVLDMGAACELLRPFRKARVRLVLEQVGPRPGDMAFTAFQLGGAVEVWTLYLYSLGVEVQRVVPQVWKKYYRLDAKGLGVEKAAPGGDAKLRRAVEAKAKEAMKTAARLEAQRRFPAADLAAKSSHNRAEALLLAEYGRTVLFGAGVPSIPAGSAS